MKKYTKIEVGQKLEFLEMPMTQIKIYCNLNQATLLYPVAGYMWSFI